MIISQCAQLKKDQLETEFISSRILYMNKMLRLNEFHNLKVKIEFKRLIYKFKNHSDLEQLLWCEILTLQSAYSVKAFQQSQFDDYSSLIVISYIYYSTRTNT
jgi:hypothetical protein